MVTNLTNTTWEFNDTLSFTSAELIGVNFSINFTAVNGNSYTYIRLGQDSFNGETFFSSVHYGNTLVYGSGSVGGWVEQFAKTITITGGQDVTNPQLISWLEANGTLQGGETPTPKLYIGNKAVTSMSIGNKAILKMYVGNSLIYEKASGEESVSITLVAEYGGANEQASVFVKFGTPPTDTNDYDYNALDGERYLIDRDRVNVGNNLQIDVSTKAYIWLLMPDTKAGYKLNNGSLVNVGTGYANATEVTLSNGDTLSLVSTLLD